MDRVRLRHVAPLFYVRDVVAATEYYVRALGFAQPPFWGDPPEFAMPARDGVIIMLKRAQSGNPIRSNNPEPGACGGPWDAHVWVDDARALHAEMAAAGAEVAYGPLLQEEYGNWEFAVRDRDGYLIAFGSDAGAT